MHRQVVITGVMVTQIKKAGGAGFKLEKVEKVAHVRLIGRSKFACIVGLKLHVKCFRSLYL